MLYVRIMLVLLLTSALYGCKSAPPVTADCAWYQPTLPDPDEIALLVEAGLLRILENIDDNDDSWETICPGAKLRLTTTKRP